MVKLLGVWINSCEGNLHVLVAGIPSASVGLEACPMSDIALACHIVCVSENYRHMHTQTQTQTAYNT